MYVAFSHSFFAFHTPDTRPVIAGSTVRARLTPQGIAGVCAFRMNHWQRLSAIQFSVNWRSSDRYREGMGYRSRCQVVLRQLFEAFPRVLYRAARARGRRERTYRGRRR